MIVPVDFIRQLVCSLDEHGPFSFPFQSTAKTSPLPPIHCMTCGADCRHLFPIEKDELGMIVTNRRHSTAIMVGWDSAMQIPERSIWFISRRELEAFHL